jgi:phosphoribosylformimino-5-aminoimidazole carboxamide ribotide isomerase
MMKLFPAIDLKDGVCVRLRHGEMSQATRYNDDPSDQARRFIDMGFDAIHVVDLDGAFGGASINHNAVNAILDAVSAPVQLGGGIRDMHGVERWLEAGVSRVVLGTAAVRDPELVKLAARTFPDAVAVGIDARGGKVAVQGWAETTDMPAIDLARAFEGCGVAALIVTDIARDGAKTGVNVEFTGEIADAVQIPVIASGGVRNVEDIRLLKARPGRPIAGAILGRALYDGDIDPAEALAAARA